MISFSSLWGFSERVSSKMSSPSSVSTARTVGFTNAHRSREVCSAPDRNRVTGSWLNSLSSSSDNPVAVTSANELIR